jgi:hypothetical protein
MASKEISNGEFPNETVTVLAKERLDFLSGVIDDDEVSAQDAEIRFIRKVVRIPSP